MRTGLGAGDPVDDQERAHLLEADLRWRAREAALQLLAVRARTRHELAVRLRKKGFPPAVVRPCLEDLAEQGLLDDAAFARSFVRDRVRLRPRGKVALARELREKGVDSTTGEQAVEEVFRNEGVRESELAREAALGWLRRQPTSVRTALAAQERSPATERARRRLHGFLARRSFGGEAALAGMRAAQDEAHRQAS